MARTGAFSGSTFLFGAPLLSVHPIDNVMEPDEPEDEANRHSSDVKADLAYRLYRLGVAAHCERMSNFRSMN